MAKGRQLLVIDLLRIVAAFGVVLHHLIAVPPVMTGTALYWFTPDAHLPAGGAWAAPGWAGVEVFFVISGYVIARSASGVDPGAFLARRALRIVPAAWICASLTALVLLRWSDVPGSDVLTIWSWAMLFLPRDAMIDPSYWTLELEIVFYLLMALALGRGGFRRAERLALALGVASVAFLLAVAGSSIAPGGLDAMEIRMTMLPHGVFFATGVLLAATHARGVSARGLALGALFAAGAYAEIVQHTRTLAQYVHGAPGAWLPALLLAAAVAAILSAHRVQPLLGRVGQRRLMRLSAATYPLYLLHQVIGSALLAAGVAAGLPVPLATAVAIAAVVALALLVSDHAEPALRAWLKRLFSTPRARPADTLLTASPPVG